MRDWPLDFWHALAERMCPEHKVGHPDPDDRGFLWHYGEAGADTFLVHSCCGYCIPPGGEDWLNYNIGWRCGRLA